MNHMQMEEFKSKLMFSFPRCSVTVSSSNISSSFVIIGVTSKTWMLVTTFVAKYEIDIEIFHL